MENLPAVKLVKELLREMIDGDGSVADFYPGNRSIFIRAGQVERAFREDPPGEVYRKTAARLELMAGINLALPAGEMRYGRILFPKDGRNYEFSVHSSITSDGNHVSLKRVRR